MKISAPDSHRARRPRPSEPVILFTVANFTFAIAADVVHEIRSADSLSGAAVELGQAEVAKVHHTVERGGRTYYVVSASEHFGLRRTRPTMVLMLHSTRTAVLVDRIENMAEISGFYPLPRAFVGEERRWYRGLAYFRERVVPVVNPGGFLSDKERQRLDRALSGAAARASEMQGTVPA